ncbi:hypothetical protein B0H13DRAFT_2106410 [Mycena leptocephala]|nr:hypothetical protein B0H13DRAFT_2106410 [Mycena leptocephala]
MAPASFPGIQYDNSGRPWFHKSCLGWLKPTTLQRTKQPNLQSPQQAPFPSQLDHSTQAAAQVQALDQFVAFCFTDFLQAFNFPPAGPSSRYPPVIDPLRLPPLPDDEDLDLSDPPKRGSSLPPKLLVFASRTPRGRSTIIPRTLTTKAEHPSKRGRRKGSQNWSKEDIKKLLDPVQKLLPLGQKGWKTVTERFGKWADASKRPQRDGKAIESKYKVLLKTKKPTGDAYYPPEIKGGHQIEDLINQHADTRELSDDSDVGAGDESDDSIEVLDHSVVRTAVAHRAPTPPFVLTTQFFALTQQLRDAQAANEGLCNQLAVFQNHTHDVERARDRAELRLERYEQGPFGGGSQRRSRAQYIAEEYPDLIRCDGKIRSERVYPEGGGCTKYFTDSDYDWEKENRDPSSSSPFDLTTSSSGSSLPQPSSSSSGADLPGPSTAGTGPLDV